MARLESFLNNEKLPVFVFPPSIIFYFDDPASYKQILTLYNPYDFTIKFKVLCTSPRKYNVVEPEGYIRPGACLDITVRLIDASISNIFRKEEFRVQMQKEDKASVNGKRDLTAILYPTRDNKKEKENDFESMSNHSKGEIKNKMNLTQDTTNRGSGTRNINENRPHPIHFITAILCGVVLCLPTEEKDSSLPSYLHLSSTPKIIAAYMLGIITVVLCKYS